MNDLILKYFLVFFFIPFIGMGQENILSYQQLTSESYLYERMDFEIALAVQFSNPYDANEIALDLVLTSPSSKELILPCFYVSN